MATFRKIAVPQLENLKSIRNSNYQWDRSSNGYVLSLDNSSDASSFQVGETITGGTSGASGTLDSIVGTTGGSLILSNVSGDFQTSETVTGGTSSATGTIDQLQLEYYLQASGGGNPNIEEPNSIKQDSSYLGKGTVGSLASNEWDYGDNDSLGFNTIYIKLNDYADPDTKPNDSINAVYYRYTYTLSANHLLLTYSIRNYSSSSCSVTVSLLDSSDNLLAFLVNLDLSNGESFYMNSKDYLESGEKIVISSDVRDITVYMSLVEV